MIKHKLMIFSIISNSIAALVISALTKKYIPLVAYMLIIILIIISSWLKITKVKQALQFIFLLILFENTQYNLQNIPQIQFLYFWIYFAHQLYKSNAKLRIPLVLYVAISFAIKITVEFNEFNDMFYFTIITAAIYTFTSIVYIFNKCALYKRQNQKAQDLEMNTPRIDEFQRVLTNKTQNSKNFDTDIFDHFPLGIIILTSEHEFQYMNKKSKNILELSSGLQIHENNVVETIKTLLKKCINEKIMSAGNLQRPSQTKFHQLLSKYTNPSRTSMPQLDDQFLNQLDPLNNIMQQYIEMIPSSNQVLESKNQIFYVEKGKKKCFRFHFSKFQCWIIVTLIDQTQKIVKLEQSNKYIFQHQLLNSFSHELKTPINCIQQLLEVLKLKLNDQLKETIIKPIQGQTDLLLCQINDILDYASLEINDFQWDYSLFYLEELLEECIQIYQQACQQKKINIQLINNTEQKILINNDYKRIKQVIINLLNNSTKFTAEYGIVAIEMKEISKQLYQVTVIDSGQGLTHEQMISIMKNLDEDFQSSFSSLHFGLGLKVANKLARGFSSLKEGLKIASAQNQGTLISFRVENFVDDEVSSDSQSIVRQLLVSKQLSSLTTNEFKFMKQIICCCKKILIVDDIPFNHHALKLILNEFNIQADSAYDGIQAVRIVEERQKQNQCHSFYSVIFMDIEMPKLNGFDTSLKIKQILGINKDQTNIVMCSAYDNQECIKMSQKCQMSDILPKPITKQNLQYLLEKFLK